MNDETRADVSQLSDAINDMNAHLQEINFSEIESGYWGFLLSVDSLLAICNRHQSRITELEPRSCVQAGIQYVHKEVERLVAELIELDGKIKAAKDPVSASAFEDGERLWRTDSLLRIMDRAERDIVSAIYAVLSLEQAKGEATMTAKAEGDREASDNLAAAAKTMAASPGAMQLRTLQTIDGLGPTASNTVVLGIPVDVMDALHSFRRTRHRRMPDTEFFVRS